MTSPRITLAVSSDGLRALATVVQGAPMAAEDLDGMLAKARVTFGLDDTARAALSVALSDGNYEAERLILARGREGARGVDGLFEPAFEPGIRPGHVREDGTMDFFDRELLKPVTPGQVVGRVHPPKPGVPGMRVDGGAIGVPAVRPCTVRFGAGLVQSEDGTVSATMCGVLAYEPHKSLQVVQRLVHGGDVDLRSGHLVMEGAVEVKGTVTRGFRVEASGDVDVRGSVDGGSVHAGGHVRVSGIIRGGESGNVWAEGDLQARSAEFAWVTAGGRMVLDRAVHAELRAAQIQIAQVMRGGSAQAECAIVLQEAGAPEGHETALTVGVPAKEDGIDVRHVLAAAKQERFVQHRAFGAGAGLRGKGGKMARAQAAGARASILSKLQLAERREELLRAAYVEVKGTAHPGTIIAIGEARLVLAQPQRRVRFVFAVATRTISAERSEP